MLCRIFAVSVSFFVLSACSLLQIDGDNLKTQNTNNLADATKTVTKKNTAIAKNTEHASNLRDGYASHAAFGSLKTKVPNIAPEPDIEYYQPKPQAYGKSMVTTPHTLATQVARGVLQRGGNAVDAAVAASVMLTLVEPQSSGIGGGGFMLTYNAKTKEMTFFDGRETAPASMSPYSFISALKTPMPFYDAVRSGRSVGVPGLVKMLETAHEKQGKAKWYDLWIPTANLSLNGFAITPRLYDLLKADPYLINDPAAREYFYQNNGQPKPVGTILQNPALAKVIKSIAVNKSRAFYADFATDAMISAVNARTPKHFSINDFMSYDVVTRKALCGTYQMLVVCGAPPPSAGGVVTLQTLKLLEPFNINKMAPGSPQAIHLITEATKLAYADRNAYIADPDFVSISPLSLLDSGYIAQRRKLISPDKATNTATAGKINGGKKYASIEMFEPLSTSHISIVDKEGNAVAITTSIENAFGARLMVNGYLMNNQLTDFAFSPVRDGKDVANKVQAGKRPRSSMSPTMIFDKKGNLTGVFGSVGGPYITPHVIQAIISSVDWNNSPEDIVKEPHFANLNGETEVEAGRTPSSTITYLQDNGHSVSERTMSSGLNIIVKNPKGGWIGASDARREGVAVGD